MTATCFRKSLPHLIKRGEWQHVRIRLGSNWGRFEAQKVYKTPTGQTTALHVACQNKPPQWIIEALIQVNPNALMMHCGSKARTPLQIACTKGACLDVVKTLLFNCPSVLDQVTLNLAAKRGASKQVIAALELGPDHYIAAKHHGSAGARQRITSIDSAPLRDNRTSKRQIHTMNAPLMQLFPTKNPSRSLGKRRIRNATETYCASKASVCSTLTPSIHRSQISESDTSAPDDYINIPKFVEVPGMTSSNLSDTDIVGKFETDKKRLHFSSVLVGITLLLLLVLVILPIFSSRRCAMPEM